MMLQQTYIDRLITAALEEDIHYIDVTTDNLMDDAHTSEAYYLAKDSGVLCGIDVAKRVFELVGGRFQMDIRIHDGEKVKKGDIIATMTGSTKTLLKGERTALNILQHMSGIATATSRCVELVEGTRAQITDTRKTLPGLRPLQKYAVTVGGGKNHRYNLSDGAMLKDNHIDAAGGVTRAIEMARAHASFTTTVEIECENLNMVREAVEAGADIIMFDNMTHDDMAAAIELIAGRAKTECSGNVDASNIRALADLGVDFISSGALTHSAPILDLSLKHLRLLDGK